MNIIWSEKINLIQILLGLKNHPNTNTNIIRFEKITRIRIWILFGLNNHLNTNTNIIRFENIDRIRIFWYSNIIRIIFEYRIIRSPLFWSMDCLIKKKVRDLISNHKNSVPPQKLLFKHNSKDWSKAKCAPMTLLASLSWER